jgi:hypothetical protein
MMASEIGGTMAPLDNLAQYIQGFHQSWARQTKFYGTVSSVVRVALIISTAVVGAQKTLEPYWSSNHGGIFSILALAVAIGTAFDAWLKPREKWRGFMSDRDDAKALLMRVQATDRNDLETYNTFLNEFRTIQQRHVEKNVY